MNESKPWNQIDRYLASLLVCCTVNCGVVDEDLRCFFFFFWLGAVMISITDHQIQDSRFTNDSCKKIVFLRLSFEGGF